MEKTLDSSGTDHDSFDKSDSIRCFAGAAADAEKIIPVMGKEQNKMDRKRLQAGPMGEGLA